MHCVILFRDSAGWLPTAQELRRCGFGVSTAALPPADSPILPAERPELALAAEPTAPYGKSRNQAERPEPLHAGQARQVWPAPGVAEQKRPGVASLLGAEGAA